MESLRSELLEIIADALPETSEVTKFCEEGFGDMLDSVMAKIKECINTVIDED